jgi:hypothetical protein
VEKVIRAQLFGKRFGKLTAIEIVGKTKNGSYLWRCKCECGNEAVASSANLMNGHTKSCGCLRADRCREIFSTHGLEHTRIYGIWSDMKNRCQNKRNIEYHRYGGRGISICDEWKDDVIAFFDWAMANGYREGLTLDRRDNEGNYDPSNCRWVDRKTQQNNRRNSIYITVNGVTLPCAEWARRTGIPKNTIRNRLIMGWSAAEAVTRPVLKKQKRGTAL